MKNIIFTLTSITIILFSATSSGNRIFKPSDLNRNPAAFDGKIVLLSGYITLTPSGHSLYESKELNDEFRRRINHPGRSFNPADYDKYCVTIANTEPLRKAAKYINSASVTVKARFLATYLKAGEIDLGACSDTAIEIDVADFVRRYPAFFRQTESESGPERRTGSPFRRMRSRASARSPE